jgi:hypothetical protein
MHIFPYACHLENEITGEYTGSDIMAQEYTAQIHTHTHTHIHIHTYMH